MTKIRVLYRENRVVGLQVSGHTGYAREGKDIVCAAVSAIVQTAYLGVNHLTGVKVEYQSEEGFFRVEILGGPENEQEKASLILSAALEGLKDLQSGYPRYIKMED